MIRLTVAGAVADAPVILDESIVRFVGPAGDVNATTMILQQNSDVPILVRESVDQIEQLIKESKNGK